MDISVLFSNLVGLFALIGVGFGAVRGKILHPSAAEPLTALLMKIAVPLTIFASMLRPFEKEFLWDALTIFVLGMFLHLAYIGLSGGMTRFFRVPQGRRGMWTLCCSFSNNCFMGFPVVYAIFGSEGLALAAMLGIPFNLLCYTLGAKMTIMDRVEAGTGVQVPWKKVIFSQINLATLLGLIFYCGQIPIPAAVMTPIQQLSNVTTPLSMIVTGMSLANSRLASMICDRDAITASLVRLLLFPVLTWGMLRLLPISNPLVVGVTLIIMAMPAPASSTILGEEYGGCTELAARTVFLSSLMCIVTIPLIALLL